MALRCGLTRYAVPLLFQFVMKAMVALEARGVDYTIRYVDVTKLRKQIPAPHTVPQLEVRCRMAVPRAVTSALRSYVVVRLTPSSAFRGSGPRAERRHVSWTRRTFWS